MATPVIEWRNSLTPFGVLASVALTGSGVSGAIPVGTSSSVATVRVYNNFSGAGSIADATSAVLAVYDDTSHQGVAVNTPTTGLYINVEVTDYNGVTTGGDIIYFAIGGTTKHPIPTNGGTIAGASANYCTVNIKAVVPAGATQGSVSWGIWLEYNSTG